jgi:beta-lactamase class A
MSFVDQEAALARLFSRQSVLEDWFSVNMREQDMPAAVSRAIGRLRQQYGDIKRISREPDHYLVTLERAEAPVRIALDPHGRIAGLLLQPAIPTTGSLDSFVETVAALPGQTACLIATDGMVLHSHNADLPLAVGSAMKLAVLEAVALAVSEGRLQWQQVCALHDEDRSLPSGILQDWPSGARLTVESLAALMISISDNTATDFLLHLAGRAAVEKVAPSCRPFLTTREACILKAAPHASLRSQWLEGDMDARRALLARLASLDLPSVQDMTPGNAPEIEWFLTAAELYRYLCATRELPTFRINSGPVDRRHWRRVAFKGGSEANVLNLSVALGAKDGREHCVVVTWNSSEEINPERLMTPLLGIMHALRSQKAP